MLKAAIGVMELFFAESEVDMKIRQAKKIMKEVYKTRYWAYRQGYYCGKMDAGKLAGDHRLLKAMRLTKKWESRKIRNDVNTIGRWLKKDTRIRNLKETGVTGEAVCVISKSIVMRKPHSKILLRSL
jgi:hypothetical protein